MLAGTGAVRLRAERGRRDEARGDGRWLVGDLLFTQAGNFTATVTTQAVSVDRDAVAFPFAVAASAP